MQPEFQSLAWLIQTNKIEMTIYKHLHSCSSIWSHPHFSISSFSTLNSRAVFVNHPFSSLCLKPSVWWSFILFKRFFYRDSFFKFFCDRYFLKIIESFMFTYLAFSRFIQWHHITHKKNHDVSKALIKWNNGEITRHDVQYN